jgi:RND family efflux transporter MFP subunit
MSAFMRPSKAGWVVATVVVLAGMKTPVSAQQRDEEVGAGREHVVIERTPLVLRDPKTYQVAMHLEPVTSVRLVARLDGIVNNVLVKPGEKMSAQEEVVRMESRIRQLELERAKAAFQLAQLEHDAAAESQTSDVAAARLEVVRFDLRLAEERLDDTIVRAPFEGTVTAVHVVPGQFVRAGDPLVTLADLARLNVDMPVSRRDVKEGDSLDVRVEDETVTGKVAQVLPLSAPFEPLRDLFLSIATARVTVDGGGLSVGQTVYSDLIPRNAVCEVPTAALLNTDDGQRKVQVIREEYVRDVVVQLLGQNGEDYVFVSGRFGPADELVVKTSEELFDGTRIVPSTAVETQGGPAGTPPVPSSSRGSQF